MRAGSMLLSLLVGMPWAVPAATIEGRVMLYSDGKPLRAEEAAEAVVYFRPSAPAPVAAAAQTYTMTTQRKQFVPRILPVTVGSTVSFPNQDPILHNAFSTSKDNAFDIGLYGQGEGKVQKFDHAGYVRVYCNVHHSMVGHILVLDTPHFGHPDAQGAFRLTGLPEGKGDLVVWFDRATPWHQPVTPGQGGAIEVRLDLAQKKIPPHMNKFGKPYGRTPDGGY
jgi:plastocyanin